MKKVLLAILSMVLLLSLAACGGGSDSGTRTVKKKLLCGAPGQGIKLNS